MKRLLLPWHHHPGHPHVVVPVRVDATGRLGPTPSAARCGRWRRVAPGWFVPAEVDGTAVDQRIVEAAVHLVSWGGVTGWAALHWMGARWSDGSDASGPRPVMLATGDAGIRADRGVEVSEEHLRPADVIVVDGLRVTTAVRSVLFEMRHASDALGAVTALDMACFSDLVSVSEATAYAATLGTWTGIPRGRGALEPGDENAWSPTEVASRIIWRNEVGLPRPWTNAPVFDLGGRHLVTPDLLDPVLGVVAEYDGDVHLHRGAKLRDVRRDELYRRLGLEQVTIIAPDLREPSGVAARLHDAYRRAAARPASERGWTAQPPPWWTSTRTVAERRALSAPQRARLLRHREAA